MKRTSVFENGLIWFGAAISLAEILTGTYFAPLGLKKGFAAIVTGHIIGCILLFLAGYMGGRKRLSAMETVRMSFGQKGSLVFALLNVFQLVGWTGIMIFDGAAAANGIFVARQWVWVLVIGGLIVVWLLIGIKSLKKLNVAAMAGLFAVTVMLSFAVFGQNGTVVSGEAPLSFGAAVEMSVAMPLSWLPLISDYSREAEKPVMATAVSAVTYGIVSGWMYVIGMGAAMFAGTGDIAQIMVSAGLGTAGLVIVVLSTVTTTFLDAYSAGVSAEVFSDKVSGKWIAILAVVLGTMGALFCNLGNITDFLYFIGSVFAPMIAVQIADFFILKKDSITKAVDLGNIVVWILGFATYRLLMKVDCSAGSTIPAMAITIVLCVIFDRIKKRFNG